MNRRKFFAFLPVAPMALVAEGARAVAASQAPPSNEFNMTLMGAAPRNKNKNEHGPAEFKFTSFQSDPSKAVSMAVGEDGELWLKSKDKQWKKVVTQ